MVTLVKGLQDPVDPSEFFFRGADPFGCFFWDRLLLASYWRNGVRRENLTQRRKGAKVKTKRSLVQPQSGGKIIASLHGSSRLRYGFTFAALRLGVR
jgi:hypothetical protein